MILVYKQKETLLEAEEVGNSKSSQRIFDFLKLYFLVFSIVCTCLKKKYILGTVTCLCCLSFIIMCTPNY